ncbi:MAG: VTT domain-containing protein [Paracoccaceae bacterium]
MPRPADPDLADDTTGGALAAAGDLALWQVVAAAWTGAVLGDQAGFLIGRFGGTPVVDRLARSPARAAVLARARALVDRRGGVGVFLSTWAVAPLGPWVNFIAGATGLGWLRFSVADVIGEVIWSRLHRSARSSPATSPSSPTR